MWNDPRLDVKLTELKRELLSRPLVPGFNIVDAYATAGLDETGKPGFFAAVLLAPTPAPELGVLSALRQAITARLKQVDSRLPAFPIVVQGAPEMVKSTAVVPGGPETFESVKSELAMRRERLYPPSVKLVTKIPTAAVRRRPPAKASRRAEGLKRRSQRS